MAILSEAVGRPIEDIAISQVIAREDMLRRAFRLVSHLLAPVIERWRTLHGTPLMRAARHNASPAVHEWGYSCLTWAD